ncbi:LOW QUALITY PROTEIN: DNA repair protein SWI5 homolog [Equus asinus]|uniref:LOW QUALITY PROTEIN: DNA repair protein SWI5 homolog n=1 Tax=Equus asinus TaxID=9793 RepID=UPI001D03FB96|nr:LOW QUALITY PROTEIN: DNA repair protein SWI5 homolog [Equus asinus]
MGPKIKHRARGGNYSDEGDCDFTTFHSSLLPSPRPHRRPSRHSAVGEESAGLGPRSLETGSRGPGNPGGLILGGRRTQPGLSKSCRGAFRSPRPSPKSDLADGTSEDSLHLDIQKLKEKRDMLDKEISQLLSEGYSVGELEDHISQLHMYNDIKDIGQMLLGKLAVIRGVTTRELYPEFGLDMSD